LRENFGLQMLNFHVSLWIKFTKPVVVVY
jgi:hypothetical protein